METMSQSKKRENSVVWLHGIYKQTSLDTGCHGSKLQKLTETCILTQMYFQWLLGTFFHLQSLHGLKMREGSRDELGDSVVVQKPEGERASEMIH